mgnify:CR=1
MLGKKQSLVLFRERCQSTPFRVYANLSLAYFRTLVKTCARLLYDFVRTRRNVMKLFTQQLVKIDIPDLR